MKTETNIMRSIKQKNRAISLRLQGKTYAEIKHVVGEIPKSTLNGWFKKIKLTEKQEKRIQNIIKDGANKGRWKGVQTNKKKRLERVNKIKKIAEREWQNYHSQPLFLTGLALYLAEGNKKSEQFQFMNSDPRMIMLVLKWLKMIQVPDNDISFRLYIHEVYKAEDPEHFWQEFLQISKNRFKKTVLKPSKHHEKKNPEYKGCLRIEVKGSELYWKIISWQDKFYMHPW